MAKAPTRKSRLIAATGICLVGGALVLDAWFSPPLPRFSTPIFSLLAVGFMQWAKQVREYEGIDVPDDVMRRGKTIAYIEVASALACGFSVMTVLISQEFGLSKRLLQWETTAALLLFACMFTLLAVTRSRFDAMMAADSNHSAGS